MDKCLYCYGSLNSDEIDFHPKCAKLFFGTKQAPKLPYNLKEMEVLARQVAEQSITVPGVQPKLSLGWIKNELEDGHKGRLTIMDALKGEYILKPQNVDYPQMPENEHLSMRLAQLFKIDIVPVSMIRLASGELCFITKRIDRNENGTKNHMIDFLQILELSDKYMGTKEKLGKAIGELSENTLLDKLRFFESVVFNYVIGNNDMHLKNYSMFLSQLGWTLSPFYDFLNVKLVLPKDDEDTALLLGGKKKNFKKVYFDRLAEGLQLNSKQMKNVYKRLEKWLPKATDMIALSFLDTEGKITYEKIIKARVAMFIN